MLIYQQAYLALSPFAAFAFVWTGRKFATAWQAYHHAKFQASWAHSYAGDSEVTRLIELAESAYAAETIARQHRLRRRPDWPLVRCETMYQILRAVAAQHEVVRCVLLGTGQRPIVENSPNSPFWGQGRDGLGRNELGATWMRIRAEFQSAAPTSAHQLREPQVPAQVATDSVAADRADGRATQATAAAQSRNA